MSEYSFSDLIDIIHKKGFEHFTQICNSDGFSVRYDYGFSPFVSDRNIKYVLDLINYVQDNNTIIDIHRVFDMLGIDRKLKEEHIITLFDIGVRISYDIEKMLCKIYNYDTIVHILNNISVKINYDYIFDLALKKYSNNRAIFEYIILNNCVDYNSINYYKYEEYDSDHAVLDPLLTAGFDISKYPTDTMDVSSVLLTISLPNLICFSDVKIRVTQFISIISGLECKKLEEFLKYYNTTNIIYSGTNNAYKKRAQIFINSFENAVDIMSVILELHSECECDWE